MTLPFENNTSPVVKKLVRQRIKTDKGRNLFLVFAVSLTTILFSTLFSIGGGFLDQVRQNQQQEYGTAHATVKFLSEKQYNALLNASPKKDISYTRLVGTPVEESLKKIVTEIRFAEDTSAKSFLCYPSTGTMPQKEDEIATSTLVLEALGIPAKVGAALHLTISVDGKMYDKNFVLSGFWEGYSLAMAQEMWVSRPYADAIAPAAQKDYNELGQYAGLYCADVYFNHTLSIRSQLKRLLEDAQINDTPDAVNPTYDFFFAQNTIDFSFILALAALLGTIMLAGYLIIYNLFSISVTSDIHFFGLLRTIGASSKQLKKIVRSQALTLSVFGLPIGLLIGYFIGRVLLPFVLTQINVTDTGVYRVNPFFFIAAILFTLLTVYISSIKPCRYAAKIPPIEAIRYSGIICDVTSTTKKIRKITPFSMAMENTKRSKKKLLLVVLSFSFSLILLNTTYTAIHGFDLDAYIKKNAVADFYVTDYSIRSYGYNDKNLSGISDGFLTSLSTLPGLENNASVYAKEIWQPIPEDMAAQFEEMSNDNTSFADTQFLSEKCTFMQIYGIHNDLTDMVTLTAGEWNQQKWDSGNYVIIDDFFHQGTLGNGQSPFYQVGDSLVLYDGSGQAKTYTVMGIGNLNYNLDAQYYSDFGLRAILPEHSYRSLYGETQPLCTIFNVNDANTENAENWIMDYCNNVENNLTYISHKVYAQEFQKDKTTYSMVGGILTLILGFIGILNFVNAIATSIILRQKELAMLGAIGMNEKQVKQMLIYESLVYIILALLFSSTVGSFLCYFICTNLISNMWAFTYHFTLFPILLCMPFFLGIVCCLPLMFYKKISRQSIVTRLRQP